MIKFDKNCCALHAWRCVICYVLDNACQMPAANRLKQSPRPDIVSNSVIDENSASEIARLEVLCEAKTKEVAALRNELCERVRWFEAMAVVVSYFVSKVSFSDCGLLVLWILGNWKPTELAYGRHSLSFWATAFLWSVSLFHHNDE